VLRIKAKGKHDIAERVLTAFKVLEEVPLRAEILIESRTI
jgi:hypothetical protein